LVTSRLLVVWAKRRRGLAGSRLQVQLVGLFSVIAVFPTIIVAVFSYCSLASGSKRGSATSADRDSPNRSRSRRYLKEHQQAIRADVLAMSTDLNRNASTLQLNPQYLPRY